MSRSDVVLLRGRCRLEFEACEFVPAGSSGEWSELCWLVVHAEALTKVKKLLGTVTVGGWFEAEFFGHLTEKEGQYGHLGVYRRCASMEEVVTAQALPDDPVESSTEGGTIRERLSGSKKATF